MPDWANLALAGPINRLIRANQLRDRLPERGSKGAAEFLSREKGAVLRYRSLNRKDLNKNAYILD